MRLLPLTIVATLMLTAAEPLLAQEPNDDAEVAPAAAPTEAPPAAAPDFAALDKAALVLLCQQYHRMNQILEKRVAELEAIGTPASEDAISIEALQRQLAALEDRLSLWMAATDEADSVVLIDEATLGKPIVPTPPYRYEYELNLIGEKGTTRFISRDEEGKLKIEKVSYSDYRNDLIEVRTFFRNDSPRRARFNMLVGLGENRIGLGLIGNRPRLVGRDSYTTPYLVPGEVHAFTLRIPVDNAFGVDFAELGKVRAFE